MQQILNLVLSKGVNDLIAVDEIFAKHVVQSIARFRRGDWGEMSKEDLEANDTALDSGDRIFASYLMAWRLGRRIWIIRDSSAGQTTVLFPSEY